MKKKIFAVLCVVVMMFNCMVLPTLAAGAVAGMAGLILTELGVQWFAGEISQATEGIDDASDTRLIDWMYTIVANDTWGVSTETRTITEYVTPYGVTLGWSATLENQEAISKYLDLGNGACEGHLSPAYLEEYYSLFIKYWASVLTFNGDWGSFIDKDDFCAYMYNRYFDDYGSAGDGVDMTYSAPTLDPISVDGETFADICDRLAAQYAPDAETEYISWKKEKHPTYGNALTWYMEGTFCNTSDWYDCYIVPFFYDGSNYYYGLAQYHYYQQDGTLRGAMYNNLDVIGVGLDNYTPQSLGSSAFYVDTTTYRYISLRAWVNPTELLLFTSKTYTEYITGSTTARENFTNYEDNGVYLDKDLKTYTVDDLQFVSNGSLNSAFFPKTDSKKDLSTPYDIGWLVSDEFIEMGGYIQPIPLEHLEDTTVTLAGDTIYDYTITNNTTGDTSTVNYFVTNNYTYENSGGSSDDSGSSDGGTTSGDVNVGGKVDVSGDIEVGGKVDININVEQGSGGSTEDIKGYEYEEVNLEEALEQIPEMSTGFTNWFSRVFAFLPPDLMGLLLGGIAIAILLRIAGR